MVAIQDKFQIVIMVMLFYSAAISLISYSVPADSLTYINTFTGATDDINLNTVSQDVQASMQKQTDIPVIELGSLIFYSGNILIDFIMNFVFALPEMFGLLIHGLTMLVNIDPYIYVVAQLFATVALVTFYLVELMQLLVGIRSSRVI